MSLFPDEGLLAGFLLFLFLYQLYTHPPVWNSSITHCESTSRHPHNKNVSVVPIMIIPSASSEPGNPSVSLLPLYGMCLCVLILLNSCMNTLFHCTAKVSIHCTLRVRAWCNPGSMTPEGLKLILLNSCTNTLYLCPMASIHCSLMCPNPSA